MGVLWTLPSIAVVALLALGVLGSAARVVSPEIGFSVFAAGLLLSALLLPIFGGAAAFASSTGRSWRPKAVRAAVVPLLVVVGILIPNLARVNPAIHDITTDPGDALAFPAHVSAGRVDPQSQGPERPQVLAQQRQYYPDVVPLELPSLPPERAFAAALTAAEQMEGWQIQDEDAATGMIEVTAVSGLFHFVDDVVIRVAPSGAGSRIDMRSRSRFGQGDLGANAKRIRAYFERLRSSARAG